MVVVVVVVVVVGVFSVPQHPGADSHLPLQG